MTIKTVEFGSLKQGERFCHFPDGAICRKISAGTWQQVAPSPCKLPAKKRVYPIDRKERT